MMAYDIDEGGGEGNEKTCGGGDEMPVASSRGCRQRLHKVSLTAVAEARSGDDSMMITVFDTFVQQGLQDEVRVAAGSSGLFVREAMQQLSQKEAFIPSDKYNLPEVLLLQKHHGDAKGQDVNTCMVSDATATSTSASPQATTATSTNAVVAELDTKRFRRE